MVSEGKLISQEVEQIPDEDLLFMRAHRMFFRDGQFAPGVFRDQGDGMSVDWERYSTPEETRLRARRPEDNAVIEMVTGEVRAIPPVSVEWLSQSRTWSNGSQVRERVEIRQSAWPRRGVIGVAS